MKTGKIRSDLADASGNEKKAARNLLFAKRPSPKIGGVGLGNAECVSLELSTWKDGFDLGQHVTEDQRELGEVASAREQDEQRQKHWVSTLNRQEISSQCKCTHTQRKVNSQQSLLSEFLVLELVWKLMCHTRLPSNSMRIQCNLMHAVMSEPHQKTNAHWAPANRTETTCSCCSWTLQANEDRLSTEV